MPEGLYLFELAQAPDASQRFDPSGRAGRVQ
jgi:hypothetical protein